MTPTSPPKLARQVALPDPFDGDELPPFSLPVAYLAVGSKDPPATPNLHSPHDTTSQPTIGETAPLSPLQRSPENRAPLYTTPKILQLWHTNCAAIPRPVALPDPVIEAAMPPLKLPVSQANMRHHLTNTAGDMLDASILPEPSAPTLDE